MTIGKSSAEIIEHRVVDARASGRRGIGYMIASRFSGMLIGLVSSAFMGRLLSPQEYGLVAMAASVMIFLNLLKDFGLTTALIQHDDLSALQLDAIFWINLYLSIGLAVIGALVSPLIARIYGQPLVAEVIVAMCVGLVIVSASATHSAMLRRRLNFEPLMWAEIGGQLASLVIGVGVALWTRSLWAIVSSQLAAALVTSLVTFLGIRWRPGKPRELGSAMALVKVGANLSVFSFLNFFSNQLGAIIVGIWLGPVAAGHFNRAQQLLTLSGNTLMQPIGQTTLPVLSRLRAAPSDYRSYYLHLLARTSLGFSAIGALVIVAGDGVTALLLGPKWGVAGDMYRWFGLSIMAVGMASQTGNVLISQSRTVELRAWGWGDALIRAGASAIGVVLGAVGVAAAFGTSTLFITVPIVAWIVARSGPLSLRDQILAYRPGLVVAAVSAAIGLSLRGQWWPARPIEQVAVGVAVVGVSAVVAWLVDRASRRLFAEVMSEVRGLAVRAPRAA